MLSLCVLAILVLFPSRTVAWYVQWTVSMCWWMYTNRSERARARKREIVQCFRLQHYVDSNASKQSKRFLCNLLDSFACIVRTHTCIEFDSIQLESAHSFFRVSVVGTFVWVAKCKQSIFLGIFWFFPHLNVRFHFISMFFSLASIQMRVILRLLDFIAQKNESL